MARVVNHYFQTKLTDTIQLTSSYTQSHYERDLIESEQDICSTKSIPSFQANLKKPTPKNCNNQYAECTKTAD